MTRIVPPGYSARWPHVSALRDPSPWWASSAYLAEDEATGDVLGPAAALDVRRGRAMIGGQSVTFSDMITFTRAGPATYIGPDGLLHTAGVDVPRFDYTHGQRGLLLEGSATNLLLYSQNFDDGSWQKTNSAEVTPNYATAPDGTLTAARAVFPSGTLARLYQAVISPTVNTFSVWMRSNTGADQTVTLRLRRADFGAYYGTAEVTVTPTWQRFAVTGDCTESGGTGVMGMLYHFPDSLPEWDLQIWGAQIETGSYPSSYIPTAGSAVTRPADKAQLSEAVAALLRRGEASVLLQGEGINLTTTGTNALLSGPASSDTLIGMLGVTGGVFIGKPNVTLVTTTSPLPSFGLTSAWSVDGIAGSYQGGSVASRPDIQEAGFSAVFLGRTASSNFAPGWYYQLPVWLFRITNADIQAKAVPYA